MVINVGRTDQDRSLINSFCKTIGAVFPSVYVMDVPGSFNTMVYATRQPTRVENLYQNFAAMDAAQTAHPLLRESIQRTIVYLQPTPAPSVVYTDDLAPIEWITNAMVVSYVIFGDLEVLH
jgi:hypothetical protein